MLRVLVLLLLSFSINSHAAIGKITEGRGSGEILRNKTSIDAKVNTSIESMDSVHTANGVINITFEDDTKVRITEHSKLIIDDFVYDPKAKGAGKLAVRVALGTVRYASGAVAKDNAKNVNIKTPTATIAVRGTAFSMTVDEIGQSMIILLPNVDGSVGVIDVMNGAGSVTLTQAFQATMTTVAEVPPAKPIILKITESAINNLLIVSPPTEVVTRLVESTKDVLSFNELDLNALNFKVFENPLDFKYLSNALDSTIMSLFPVGFTVTDLGTTLQVDRKTRQEATMIINKDAGYDITVIQDGTTLTVRTQDTTTNTIVIKQGSK